MNTLLACSAVRALRTSLYATKLPQIVIGRNGHNLSNIEVVPQKDKLFGKILIANRGEIACRVMRTCKRLGIKTVAVYSDADINSQHVRMADEAVRVGPPPTGQSYLNVAAIVDAVKKSGAEAVHPGYGFLSENFHFVQALDAAGVTFIGPTQDAMHALGDKIESKKLAKTIGVNVIPGFLGEMDTVDDALRAANEIGYPVMVKASAGGGGKGMRIAWNDEELRMGYRLSRQEAASSFGDDRMLVEKYIDQGRHIEIQVLGDSHGNALYFPERECSIQRRNQKVIEEAPSPFLDASTRKAMGEQALLLVKAVKYRSAGTVEMLVDSQRKFYFLEMNTRLQVEHPITEQITGLDLVEQMIRVAAGHPLSVPQSDIRINGWAMESRVYAEDPSRNFLPSIGKLTTYRRPTGEHVRIDGGVYEGGEISIYYDPLISKLVTFGRTRDDAINFQRKALDEYIIRGVNHNVPFLRAVMENKRFLEGRLSTKFIPEEFPDGFKGFPYARSNITELLASAAAIHHAVVVRDATVQPSAAVQAAAAQQQLVFTFQDVNYNVEITPQQGHNLSVRIASQAEDAWSESVVVSDVDYAADGLVLHANVAGKPAIVQLVRRDGMVYTLQHLGSKVDITVRTARQVQLAKFMPVREHHNTANLVRSPMPGQVHSVAVKAGDKVVVGQELLIVEAMKMQNVLRAPRDCTVKDVKVKAGHNVVLDETLIELA